MMPEDKHIVLTRLSDVMAVLLSLGGKEFKYERKVNVTYLHIFI